MDLAGRRKLVRRVLLGLCAAPVLAWLVFVAPRQPSSERDWAPDQVRLPQTTIDGERARIDNVRNNLYRSTTDYDVRWETRDYNLDRLESVWFIVEPFGDWRGPAHTFLSFGFAGGDYVAISVEIRKERGESFSPWAGLLREYELMYVVGDERDLIGLRANHRRDAVYLYPIRTSAEGRRRLFLDMLARANALAEEPEFYNTLTSTCTSNIVDHIEAIVPGRIGFSLRTLLPAHADDLAYDLGLIDTTLPHERYREAHRINAAAAVHADMPDFSTAIGLLDRDPRDPAAARAASVGRVEPQAKPDTPRAYGLAKARHRDNDRPAASGCALRA